MKYRIPYKSKEFAIQATKITVICTAVLFIYFQIQSKSDIAFKTIHHQFSYGTLALLFLCSSINIFFEVLKWQNLVSYITPISIKDSFIQTCSSMAIASFTPNGIGEYGAKVLYYPKSQTKTILLLNLLTNGIQMIWTTVLGVFGCLFLYQIVPLTNVYIYLGIGIPLLIFTLLFFFRKITIRGFSISKIIKKTKKIPQTIHYKNAFYAGIRYLVFCHQYYFILRILNVQIPYYIIILILFVVYLLASIIPTFQIADVAIKGSVGIYLFGLVGIPASIIIVTATLMWIFNYLIPSSIGTLYLFKYKHQWH